MGKNMAIRRSPFGCACNRNLGGNFVGEQTKQCENDLREYFDKLLAESREAVSNPAPPRNEPAFSSEARRNFLALGRAALKGGKKAFDREFDRRLKKTEK
jgi:hypothetical protein